MSITLKNVMLRVAFYIVMLMNRLLNVITPSVVTLSIVTLSFVSQIMLISHISRISTKSVFILNVVPPNVAAHEPFGSFKIGPPTVASSIENGERARRKNCSQGGNRETTECPEG